MAEAMMNNGSMKSKAESLASDVSREAHEISKLASKAYSDATGMVSDKVGDFQRQGKQALTTAETSIKGQPLRAVGVALGVGVLCGYAVSAFSRRNR